jgi:signal transduction histidine kinase
MKLAKQIDHEDNPRESGVRPRALPPTSAMVEANERLVEALVLAEQAQEAAERREDELRQVGVFRERLIGIVGHDLRNPLNAMMIGANLLSSSKNLSDAELEVVRSFVNSGKRMKHIIAQLLDFTRARLGGGFPIAPMRLHLPTVVLRVVEELRIVTGRKIIVHESGLLDGQWDPGRLSAAFANVLANAAEHAFPETPLEIELHGDEHVITVDITNEGNAIPPEVLQSLFEPFRQMDPLAHREQGNVGLGLYIAHESIRSHGGHIHASSSGGRTTFTLVFPRLVLPFVPSV